MILGGTRSTFGEQNQSIRLTAPSAGFGTSGRTDKVYNEATETLNLGKTSPGAQFSASAFGAQPSSKNTTSPAYHMGARSAGDYSISKDAQPGPGAYEVEGSVGKQMMSRKATAPNSKFGTGNRFSITASGKQEVTPGAGDARLAAGWMGDAPATGFHGKSKRYDTGKGLPGCTPTRMTTPGPGQYEGPSSFGHQTMSKKTTSTMVRVGTAPRAAFAKQYVSPGHERSLLGQHSPGAGAYQQPSGIGIQTMSKKRTSANTKFGSGDRFSEIKPRSKERATINLGPGPGSYVV